MLSYVIGSLLVAAGLVMTLGWTQPIRYAARVWPRAYSRGDRDLFESTAFLVRFIGLLATAAGLAVIAAQLIRS